MDPKKLIRRNLPADNENDIKNYTHAIKIVRRYKDHLVCHIKRSWWQKQNKIANRLMKDKTW